MAIDEARKPHRQHVGITQPPFFERAGLEVVDHHVGALEQAQQHLTRLRLRQIQCQRALVAVDPDEIGRGPVAERRSPVANLVALRRLDLDHVGAVVAEDLCTVRPAQHAREVDYTNAIEGAAVRLLPCHPNPTDLAGTYSSGLTSFPQGRIGTADRPFAVATNSDRKPA